MCEKVRTAASFLLPSHACIPELTAAITLQLGVFSSVSVSDQRYFGQGRQNRHPGLVRLLVKWLL